MTEKKLLPPNLPEPVVFGPDFPEFAQMMRGGKQTFQSRTNINLFLNTWHFDGAGTFTMGSLLKQIATSWQELAPLVFGGFWEGDDGDLYDWADVVTEPQWEESEAFARLLGYCDSEPQRTFLMEWCHTQYARGLSEAWDRWSAANSGFQWTRMSRLVPELVALVFEFPALIPEVWLNYVGPERTQRELKHLAENPGRVDFVLFAKARKCVIEVDGPSHYAELDGQGYIVNEQVYAKNLRIERSLRRQGWEIFRFANVELRSEDASGNGFVRLIKSAQLPGFLYEEDIFLDLHTDPPRVSDEAFADLMETHRLLTESG